MSESKLEQTKSRFRLRGKVVGLENSRSYRTGVIENGKNAGKEYRSLRFGVKTSPNNIIYVELYGPEEEFVYPYNSKKGKSLKLDFKERNNIPDGYTLIGIRCNLEDKAKNLVAYDAVEYIREHLSDGDDIYVGGELQFSTYEGRQQTRFTIKSISKLKEEINFDDENFKEDNYFEQEIVVKDVDYNKEDKKLYIDSYVIYFNDRFETANFVINADTHSKLANSFKKRCKMGTWIKVKGRIWNMAIEKEATEGDIEDDWGSEETPMDIITDYINELQIIGVDPESYQPGKYTEDDFVKDDIVEDDELDLDDDSDPFEVDEDDLPF